MKQKKRKVWPVLFLAILMVATSVLSYGEATSSVTTPASTDADNQDGIYLFVGSPLILDGDQVSFLDPAQFDVTAALYDNRTLVPLRALSEYFGAQVSYDGAKRIAIVKFGTREFQFPIGSRTYQVIEGSSLKTVTMDTTARIVNSRTLVPLRVVAEQLLNKEVAYRSGAIAIADTAVNLAGDDALYQKVKIRIGSAVKAQNLEQLKTLLASVQAGTDGSGGRDLVTTMEQAAVFESAGAGESSKNAASIPAPEATADSDGGYSQTNTQVAGVDEADIVKTDGKYLYIAGNNTVRIVRADGGKLTDAAKIKLESSKYVQEIYLDKDRLILVGNRQESSGAPDGPIYPMPLVKSILPYYFKSWSFVDVYDITDPMQPTYLKGHEMEGSYQTSRKQDGIVYLITNSNPGGIVMPLVRETDGRVVEDSVKISDITILPDRFSPGYVVLSAMDVLGDQKTQVEALTAYSHLAYMSENALYLASGDADNQTIITKIKIAGTMMGYAGSGKVPGNLQNQFSMDEYQDHLRVASTTWDKDWVSENALTILDASMSVTGSVTGLAKGETIYSVRFFGDRGYVVTFRQVDPLFVFDLSDPAAPKVTGELKVPGFSNYLHPVGENLILGIGQEIKPLYEQDASGNFVETDRTRQDGIKFSLFDVSDLGQPREVDKLVVGGENSYTEAFYNHKAVMVDPERGIVALDAYVMEDKTTWQGKQGALVVSYLGANLTLKGMLEYIQPSNTSGELPYGRRVAYIGNTLYYIQDGVITSYQYDTLQKIESLELQ